MCEKHPEAEENPIGACKGCVAEYFEMYFQRKKEKIDAKFTDIDAKGGMLNETN